MKTPPLLRALRPDQWSKNALVAAAFVFALGDRTLVLPADAWLATGIAVLCFCLVSSAVYLFNDLQDIERDRQHPRKRLRPLAAGEISPRTARLSALALVGIALPLSLVVNPGLLTVLSAYLLLQFAYTCRIKHIAYLDVVALSLGFVLRALAGASAISVAASPWLLLCTFFLALFLAFCKRSHEKSALHSGLRTRPSLRHVRKDILERLLNLSLLLSALCYAAYTVSPDALRKHGNSRMLWTLPFVILGLLRYRHLVLHEEQGDRPERQLLHDPWMLINTALYAGSLLWLLYR